MEVAVAKVGYETLQLQNRWFHEASVDRIMASSAHPSLYLDELVKALRAPRAVMPTRDAATKALGLCSGVASLLLEPAHAPADTEVLQLLPEPLPNKNPRLIASSAYPADLLSELSKALKAVGAVRPSRDEATKGLGLCKVITNLLLDAATAPEGAGKRPLILPLEPPHPLHRAATSMMASKTGAPDLLLLQTSKSTGSLNFMLGSTSAIPPAPGSQMAAGHAVRKPPPIATRFADDIEQTSEISPNPSPSRSPSLSGPHSPSNRSSRTSLNLSRRSSTSSLSRSYSVPDIKQHASVHGAPLPLLLPGKMQWIRSKHIEMDTGYKLALESTNSLSCMGINNLPSELFFGKYHVDLKQRNRAGVGRQQIKALGEIGMDSYYSHSTMVQRISKAAKGSKWSYQSFDRITNDRDGYTPTVGMLMNQLATALDKKWAKAERLFSEWDSDGDGTLSRKELSEALEALGVSVGGQKKEEIADMLFNAIDVDGSGTVEVGELREAIKKQKAAASGMQKAHEVRDE